MTDESRLLEELVEQGACGWTGTRWDRADAIVGHVGVVDEEDSWLPDGRSVYEAAEWLAHVNPLRGDRPGGGGRRGPRQGPSRSRPRRAGRAHSGAAGLLGGDRPGSQHDATGRPRALHPVVVSTGPITSKWEGTQSAGR